MLGGVDHCRRACEGENAEFSDGRMGCGAGGKRGRFGGRNVARISAVLKRTAGRGARLWVRRVDPKGGFDAFWVSDKASNQLINNKPQLRRLKISSTSGENG